MVRGRLLLEKSSLVMQCSLMHSLFCSGYGVLPPIEHVMGGAATPALGSQLGPEYFLLVWNCLLASFGKSPKDRMKSKRLSKFITLLALFMESFPK